MSVIDLVNKDLPLPLPLFCKTVIQLTVISFNSFSIITV